jgi:hypothetical protein
MEWFNKEEDYMMDDYSNQFGYETDKIADIFMKKVNSFQDFDLKLDEFLYESSEAKPTPFEFNKNLKDSSKQSTPKLFDIKKDKASHTPNTRLSSEEYNYSSENKNESDSNKDCDSMVNNNSTFSHKQFMPKCVPLNQLSISERMKIKKEKAKKLLEKKHHRDSVDNFLNLNFRLSEESNCSTEQLENSLSTGLTKKEIKMLRNRISAQKSRDRKKKEFDELKVISQNIINENQYMKKELENKNKELSELKEKISKLCGNCKKNFPVVNNENRRPQVIDVSFGSRGNSVSNRLKYSLMAGFLAVVCIIGTLSFSSITNSGVTPSGQRILIQTENIPADNVSGASTIPSTPSSANQMNMAVESKKNSTDLIPYVKEIEVYKEKSNYPFRITKDVDKLREKELLGKKRFDFLLRLNNNRNKLVKSDSFLKEDSYEYTCPNTDNISISVQDEIVETEIHANNNTGLMPKNNYEYHLSLAEDDFLRNNIKSMYCRDFISSVEENSKIFSNLFEKVNKDQPIISDK